MLLTDKKKNKKHQINAKIMCSVFDNEKRYIQHGRYNTIMPKGWLMD